MTIPPVPVMTPKQLDKQSELIQRHLEVIASIHRLAEAIDYSTEKRKKKRGKK